MWTDKNRILERNFRSIPFIMAGQAILLNGGLRVLNIWLSPTGRVLNTVIFGIWVLQVAICVWLILSFILKLTNSTELGERARLMYTAAGVYAVAGLISIPIGNLIAVPIQENGYRAFTAENQFLVEAIEAYEADHGRPPDSLVALYPDYLPSSVAQVKQVEVSDGGTRPEIVFDVAYQSIDQGSWDDVLYSYRPPEDDEPWQLQVSIYLGSFQSTRFIYNPTGRYSNRYAILGRWAVD